MLNYIISTNLHFLSRSRECLNSKLFLHYPNFSHAFPTYPHWISLLEYLLNNSHLMKQFLTFLFIWFIPILSNASAKTNTIAGNRVNSLSSKACNCFFLCDHQSIAASFDFRESTGSMSFGNNTSGETPEVSVQLTHITNLSLIIFGILLTLYLIFRVIEAQKRIRS